MKEKKEYPHLETSPRLGGGRLDLSADMPTGKLACEPS